MEEIGLAPEDIAAVLEAARTGRTEVDEAVAGCWHHA